MLLEKLGVVGSSTIIAPKGAGGVRGIRGAKFQQFWYFPGEPWGCMIRTAHQATCATNLADHCSGVLSGSIPQDYLNLEPCSVCVPLVRRFCNGCHPRCRPSARGDAA